MFAIASVTPSRTAGYAPVVAALTRLAAEVELVVVCGQAGAIGLVRQLRAALPRHNVMALLTTFDQDDLDRCEVTLIEELLDDGGLPVVVLPAGAAAAGPGAAAHSLAGRLGADEVVQLGAPTGGRLKPAGVTPLRGDVLAYAASPMP